MYNVFMKRMEKGLKIELAPPSTFRKVHGAWSSGDNPGGLATDLYLKDLLRRFSMEKALVVDVNFGSKDATNGSCTVLGLDRR